MAVEEWQAEARARLANVDLSLATPEELAALEAALETSSLGSSFRNFITKADPNFIVYPHCDLVINEMQALYDGDFDRLMVCMPPRHSKSYLGTKLFPAYYLHNSPEANLILTACTGDLAKNKFSIELREFMTQAPINLALGASKSKDIWRTAKGGAVLAAGAGGTIIGFGANLFLIDDPVKDRETATSPLQQQKIFDWYRSVADTRTEPGCKMVMIMQRWDDNDLAGRILESEGEDWKLLELPALAKEDDPLNRELGEPLCPERYPREELLRKKRSMGSVFFESMYQQSPVPEGGYMFKSEHKRYFTRIDQTTYSLDGRIIDRHDCHEFLTVDMAHSEESTADFTVIMHALVTPERDLLVNRVWRGRWSRTKAEQEILDKLNWKDNKYLQFVVIERTQASISTIEEIGKHYAVRDPKPMVAKAVRAVPPSVLQERGKLWTPDPDTLGEEWMLEFEQEVYKFPAGKHDDIVDALSLAVEYMSEFRPTGASIHMPPSDATTDFNYSYYTTERNRSRLFPWMN